MANRIDRKLDDEIRALRILVCERLEQIESELETLEEMKSGLESYIEITFPRKDDK